MTTTPSDGVPAAPGTTCSISGCEEPATVSKAVIPTDAGEPVSLDLCAEHEKRFPGTLYGEAGASSD